MNMLRPTSLASTAAVDALQPGEERPAADEERIQQAMIDSIKAVSRQRQPSGRPGRFNQAKGIACLDADFHVPDTLPVNLRHGLFARPGHYEAKIRFARASADDDRKKDFHGMSIKVFGVEGEPLWGNAGAQDFLLNSHPALFVGTPGAFLEYIESIRKGARWWFFVKPRNWGSLWTVLKGRDRIASPFDIPYWSTTPYRLGPDHSVAVKYSARPRSAFTSDVPGDADANFLSRAVADHLRRGVAGFDFMVQFQTDPVRMPVEDASVVWNEMESGFHRVARITIEQQEFLDDTSRKECEEITFNPWQCQAAHRPLGGINRVRRAVYSELGAFRNARH